jgi:uncharacterized protein (TIGR00251 family)
MNEERKFRMHDGKTGAAITVRVTPRSSRNEIAEIMNDGTIKIRLTAAPVDGAANKALIDFLAKILEVSAAQIEIVAGLSSKDKLITIANIDPAVVHERVMKHLA